METALGGCRTLGSAWVASGLGNTPGLPVVPEWLTGAVEDASQGAAMSKAAGGQ
jgi:hypothetical protein